MKKLKFLLSFRICLNEQDDNSDLIKTTDNKQIGLQWSINTIRKFKQEDYPSIYS